MNLLKSNFHFIDSNMHDLLEVAPQIIIQQIGVKPTPKIKICELVTSNTILSTFLLKSIYKFCHKIEITLVCSSYEEFDLIKNLNLDVFSLPHLNLIFEESIEGLKDNYFDILFGNLSSFSNELAKLSQETPAKNPGNYFIKTLSGKSKALSLYLDKAFLHSGDYLESRLLLSSYHITSILDFNKLKLGATKFEIIHLSFKTDLIPNEKLRVIFTPTKEILIQNQTEITHPDLPNWVLYLNNDFKAMLSKLETGIFNVDRDRQINNSMLTSIQTGDAIPVIKSKHLGLDASAIESEFNKDPCYIAQPTLEKLSVKKFINSDNIFLCPNMTPHIRIFKKPKGFLMNSSVCILTTKSQEKKITDTDLAFWRSKEFREFYKIARNKSQINLNIDKSAVFYFGVLKTNRGVI